MEHVCRGGLAANVKHRDAAAQKGAHVIDRPQFAGRNTPGNDRERMAVHHRLDVGTAAIDLRMDEAFKIGFGLAAVHDTGIQVELKNIVRRNKSGSQAPRDKKMFWVGRVALTDMAEAIDDPLPKQDVVGKSQFSRDSGIRTSILVPRKWRCAAILSDFRRKSVTGLAALVNMTAREVAPAYAAARNELDLRECLPQIAGRAEAWRGGRGLMRARRAI